jgi:hypothetical protein
MQAALKVRRARRDDFTRVQALLGVTSPAARADRKRFRRLVSTMREDCYVAERADEEPLAGLVVIAYARGLGPLTAIVRTLRGTPDVMRALLECAHRRAAARGCTQLEVDVAPGSPSAEEILATVLGTEPWSEGARVFQRAVTA